MSQTVAPNHPTPFEPYVLQAPIGQEIPLLADSPHSGVKYPKDFNFALPFDVLRSGEDTDVDALWHKIPNAGGTLLAAEFPRSYIDPNRNADDIDIALLCAPWPKVARPTEKSKIGAGLIWKIANHESKDYSVYDRLLTPEEVQARIDDYYMPYHTALSERLNALHKQFGAVWHLNLHSMPASAYENLGIAGEHNLADFVLGNRDGKTCSDEFMQLIAKALKDKGYSVALNDPYKGVALVSNYSNPAENRHSLQVEIHRKLYMDEGTRERSSDFKTLQANLADVTQEISEYIKSKI